MSVSVGVGVGVGVGFGVGVGVGVGVAVAVAVGVVVWVCLGGCSSIRISVCVCDHGRRKEFLFTLYTCIIGYLYSIDTPLEDRVSYLLFIYILAYHIISKSNDSTE